MAMESLSRSKFVPFIDVSETINTSNWTPEWKQVKYSTTNTVALNPQTETVDYIYMDAATTETTGFEPSVALETKAMEGEPVYDCMFKHFYELKTGSGMNVPLLYCFGGSEKKAWLCKNATVEFSDFATTDEKLSWTHHLGGAQLGTYLITEGVPEFTADEE